MVAARKAESEMEDAKEKVRAGSSAATEVTDGSKELGDQIIRLMATLTRAEQGTCPASAPNSPRHRGHGRGWMDRNTPAFPSSHNGQTGLGQSTSTHSSFTASRVATASQSRGSTQALTCAQGNAQNMKDPNTLQCFRCQGWGHMARGCATPAKPLNRDGGTEGMWSTPPPAAVNKLTTFPPLTHNQNQPIWSSKEERMTASHPNTIPQSRPIAHLVGCSNDAPVIIDGQEVTALIDLGTQVLSVSAQFCKELTLQIQSLGWLLELEGMGSAAIPYLGFVEVNLQISGEKNL